MTDVVIAAQQTTQQNVKSKRQKRCRASQRTEPLEVSMSKSQAEYLQELRQLWKDAP